MITSADWSFERIHNADATRAARLEICGSREMLITALVQAVQENRCVEYIEPDSGHGCRARMQFPVTKEVYDWFFNGRTGYRAQFWISSNNGIHYNREIIDAIVKALSGCPDQFFNSIRHPEAKIWICECHKEFGPTGLFCLSHAAADSTKLIVPRWAIKDDADGLRAPFPSDPKASWLEVKGAFFRSETFCKPVKSYIE
jgi:hypothetical protein